MTRVRSAVKPICASPRVAARTAPGTRIRQRMANQSLRMARALTQRIRPFRGTPEGTKDCRCEERSDNAISGIGERAMAPIAEGEPDERKDRSAAQRARHRIAAAAGTVGKLRPVYDLGQSRFHLR